MARQSDVVIQKIVPLTWLVDYVAMLKACLALNAPPEFKAMADQADAQIIQRIDEVQAYLDRLQQAQLN